MSDESLEEKIKENQAFLAVFEIGSTPLPFQLMPPQRLHAFPPFLS
jgi:hypothetical protein